MARIVALDSIQQFAAINLSSDPGYDPSDQTIPQVADITLLWGQGSGIVAHNVLHGQYQGAFNGTVAKADAILTGLGTGAQWTALAAFLAPGAQLAAVLIRDRNLPDQPIIQSAGGGHPGTSTGTELPNEVALVVTKRTAFTGPAHRGRLYIPGWATNALGANNTVAATAVTAANNWASIIAGVLQAQGFTFGIGHVQRKAYTGAGGKPHPARPKGFVPITSVAVRDNHWDSQRRRGLS